MDSEKRPLIGMTLTELKSAVKELGMPQFTASQITKWLYQQHVGDIDEMTNISKANRERLKEQFEVGAMAPIDCQRSQDGTIKYLFPVKAGGFVETVYIPDKDRATLCVSCQVGCKMNCLFCQTGKQGFEGNLTPADILNQIYALPEREQLTNIEAHHGEQCGREKQTETLSQRERVPRGHLDALPPTRAAPDADARREADEYRGSRGSAATV